MITEFSEVIIMDNTYANQCIACTVKNCKNHHQSRDYCSLDKITVGTHESDPTVPAWAKAASFTLPARVSTTRSPWAMSSLAMS